MPSKKQTPEKIVPTKKASKKKAADAAAGKKRVPVRKKSAGPAPRFIYVRIDDDNERVILDGHRIGGVTNNGDDWSYRLPSMWNERVGPFASREEASEALRKATA